MWTSFTTFISSSNSTKNRWAFEQSQGHDCNPQPPHKDSHNKTRDSRVRQTDSNHKHQTIMTSSNNDNHSNSNDKYDRRHTPHTDNKHGEPEENPENGGVNVNDCAPETPDQHSPPQQPNDDLTNY